MVAAKEHKITVKIADIEPFVIPVPEDEESFYRQVMAKINEHVRRLCCNATPDTTEVAVAKVALYYATMHYSRTRLINSQEELLASFEKELDTLLAGTF